MSAARFGSAALVAALAAASVGCAPPAPRTAVDRGALTSAEAEQHAALLSEANEYWGQRAERASLLAAIDAWERAVELKPDDWRTLLELSRATHFYADGWLRARGPRDALSAVLERGIDFAERGLAAYSPEIERRLATQVPLANAITAVGPDGIGLVFWYTANLGTWASYQGLAAGLTHKETIFRLGVHLRERAPDYFYAAPDRLLGAYFAAVPEFAGGDLARSRDHFQSSLERAPNYLGTYVLMAELYATRASDEALFRTALDKVLAAQPCEAAARAPCVQSAIAAEAVVAKRRARLLRSRTASRFADHEAAEPSPEPLEEAPLN